jgi:hypothetical protein
MSAAKYERMLKALKICLEEESNEAVNEIEILWIEKAAEVYMAADGFKTKANLHRFNCEWLEYLATVVL